ncbi:hypothetical protein ACO1O0_002014 [Amphichorda felina]
MTEFEEDEGPSSMSSEGQIWRPPSMAPSSAAPYYVADKNGNWVLANAAKSGAVKLPAVSLSSEPRAAVPAVSRSASEHYAQPGRCVKRLLSTFFDTVSAILFGQK